MFTKMKELKYSSIKLLIEIHLFLESSKEGSPFSPTPSVYLDLNVFPVLCKGF